MMYHEFFGLDMWLGNSVRLIGGLVVFCLFVRVVYGVDCSGLRSSE